MKDVVKMAIVSALDRAKELRHDSYSSIYTQALNASIVQLSDMLEYYDSIDDEEFYEDISDLLNDLLNKLETKQEPIGVGDMGMRGISMSAENGKPIALESGEIILI